jgi:hypothetical protein
MTGRNPKRPFRRAAGAGLVLMTAAAWLPGLVAQGAARPLADFRSLIQSYNQGQYDQLAHVDYGRLSPGDLSTARKLAEDRQIVAPATGASFLLEVVQGYNVHVVVPGAEGAFEAGKTLEAACTLSRQPAVPSSFTHAFQRASVAAINGALKPSRRFDLNGHLRHAGAEVSAGEGALLNATFDEATALRLLDIELPSLRNSSPQDDPLGLANMMLKKPPHQNRFVVDAWRALAKASEFSDVRAEALLRMAVLEDASGQPAQAQRSLNSASEAAPDAWVRHLIAFTRGRIMERLGQSAMARTAFVAALSEYPEGRSARLALAANSYLARLPHESDLRGALTPMADGTIDPWPQYFQGLRRFWIERRDVMRGLLR